MKFDLTDYQTEAAADVLAMLAEARTRFQRGKTTAVSLSAPTGSGKTVIATSVIDHLLYGGPYGEPNPDQVVLWITDNPSLNEQTKRKMLMASTQLTSSQLVTVDDSFDQRALDAGRVYFLNIQKLGKGATTYIETGDRRRFGLWDTIANTVRDAGADLLVVIDEAHRGTTRTRGRKTIASRVVAGGDGHPPAPVVLGISATPDRFIEAVTAEGSRTLEQHNVDVEEVRKSGLIKDLISINHPTETQPGDATLLSEAARELQRFDKLWADYADDQDEPRIRPVLVVQVADAPSDADLDRVLSSVQDGWEVLTGDAVGHAFQEHTRLQVGGRSVRYVSPPDIQDDPKLRVVLFKEALTTGWDCPRAEVMISLRTAKDHTYIAQLMGRMVRTPLARRVPSTEQLNSVALYLPHYDAESVNQVITNLTGGDTQVAAEVTANAVSCARNPAVPQDVWPLLAAVATYTRPSKLHRSQIDRLQRLAQHLEVTGVLADANDRARTHLVDTFHREAVSHEAQISRLVADFGQIDVDTRQYGVFTGILAGEESRQYVVSRRNIDDLFRRAKRRLTSGAASWWWGALCEDDELNLDDDQARLHVAAFAEVDDAVAAVEQAASDLASRWRKDFNSQITKLGDADREAIWGIIQQSSRPEQVTLSLPDDITASAEADNSYDRHVYAREDGTYPANLNTWEHRVVEAELADGAVGWYRNPTAGSRAIGIPYDDNARTMYPDLVVFRETDDGKVVVDIIDPHRPDLADAGPKWAGLAAYADRHGGALGRVLAVIADTDDNLVAVDLRNPEVAETMTVATSEADARSLFAEWGGAY